MVKKTRHEPAGLYRPEFEHDACGVGVVANTKGVASHDIIEKGMEVLVNLAHRGAAGADPKTGDGGGLLLQLPDAFFRREAGALGFALPPHGEYGVGMVFLPQGDAERTTCEAIIEQVIAEEGQRVLGWRDVPTDPSDIGTTAQEVQPVIRQVFVARGPGVEDRKSGV